jgi:hypothetical protein
MAPATPPAPAAAIPFPEVEFETRRIRTAAEPGSGPLLLTYRFVNKAGFPLAVEEFVQTCTCMTGEWDGEPVEMNRTGEIRARFLASDRRGRVIKSLTVKFVGLGPVELVAEVDVPETFLLTDRTLRWQTGGPPLTRSIDITVQGSKPIRVLSVAGDSLFRHLLETVEEGRRYRLHFTPERTDAEATGVFHMRTDAPDPRDALQGLFMLIRNGPDPAAAKTEGGSG